jgi:DNA-binding transcriptional regulator YiaG
MRAQKPLPFGYPGEPKTLGDHIKKRRLDLKMSQAEVGNIFGVSMYAVRKWEYSGVSPVVSLMPRVIEFLGYDPRGNVCTITSGTEKLIACRQTLGLTQPDMAKQLGVSLSTLVGWENGRSIPKKKAHTEALSVLFAASANPAGPATAMPEP